jgi:large repetitive protein
MPIFNGTGEINAQFMIKNATGSIIGTGMVDNMGSYSYTPLVALPDGSNTISISIIDAAGNESIATTITITIDTQAPTPLTIITPINGSTVGDNTPTIN